MWHQGPAWQRGSWEHLLNGRRDRRVGGWDAVGRGNRGVNMASCGAAPSEPQQFWPQVTLVYAPSQASTPRATSSTPRVGSVAWCLGKVPFLWSPEACHSLPQAVLTCHTAAAPQENPRQGLVSGPQVGQEGGTPGWVEHRSGASGQGRVQACPCTQGSDTLAPPGPQLPVPPGAVCMAN